MLVCLWRSWYMNRRRASLARFCSVSMPASSSISVGESVCLNLLKINRTAFLCTPSSFAICFFLCTGTKQCSHIQEQISRTCCRLTV